MDERLKAFYYSADDTGFYNGLKRCNDMPLKHKFKI